MSEEKYHRGEITRQGNELFERRIRSKLSPTAQPRDFIAIDVKTGSFEVDESEVSAIDRLTERHPEAEGRIYLRRIGSPHAYRIGGRFHVKDARPS